MSYAPFKPPFFLRPPMVQTLLASQKFRRRGPNAMLDAAQEMIIDAGDGVRLQGSFSPHPDSRGTMILLHGWEGSMDSTYVLSAGRFIYNQGYSVFRINYRDHGDSHHLNEGLFHAPQFDEVFNAVHYGASLEPDLPSFVTGFSIGGNFAMRIARQTAKMPIDSLAHIFAISPPANPNSASPVADQNPLIRRYFYKKWSRSLRKKQALFPHLYDFDDVLSEKTIMGLSDKLLAKYMPEWGGAENFFNAYRVFPDELTADCAPMDIIMDRRDPVVPAADLEELNLPDHIRLIMHDYGGHNGFYHSLRGPTWYDDHIKTVIAQYA